MLEQLNILVELQTVDKVLYDLEQELNTIPQRLDESDQAEKGLKESLTQAQGELGEVKGRRSELEKANEGIRARVRRAENRLMASKSQKEYRAATAEIEEGKDALKSNDDELLGLMERQEALEAQIKNQKAEFKKASSQAKEQRGVLAKRAKELEKETKRLNRGRQDKVKKVEKRLIEQYDFIRERKQGVALAQVITGTCQVCHMQLPAQQFNELQRMDKIMYCPSCNRLMYWVEPEKEAESS